MGQFKSPRLTGSSDVSHLPADLKDLEDSIIEATGLTAGTDFTGRQLARIDGSGNLTDLPANGAITRAHLANGVACSVIGRSPNSSGAVADIAATNNGQYLMRTGDALVFAGIQAAHMPSGIDAAKIGAGSVDNTEFGYLNGVTGPIQTQIDSANSNISTLQGQMTTVQGQISTLQSDVAARAIAPATTTQNYVPQWDSTNKTLKNGLALDMTGSYPGSESSLITQRYAYRLVSRAFAHWPFEVYNPSTSSIPNNTNTPIVFQTAFPNTYGTWLYENLPTSKIACPADFVADYASALLIGTVRMAGSSVGDRYVAFRENGVAYYGAAKVPAAASGDTAITTIVSLIQTTSSRKYYELMAWQNSGGSLTVTYAKVYVVPLFYNNTD